MLSNYSFIEDVENETSIVVQLLKRLDKEVDEIKKIILEMCEKLAKNGWLYRNEKKNCIKTFEKENYTLKIYFIHGRKGEKISGADLVLELKNNKIIFLQSKRVGNRGRINFDRYQLWKLIELEKEIHNELFHHLYFAPSYNHIPCCICNFWRLPFKLAFYHLIMFDSRKWKKVERFFHASDILFVLGNRKSASQMEFLDNGLTREEFEKLFWDCKIGCPDINEKKKEEILHLYSSFTSRIIIWIDVKINDLLTGRKRVRI